MPFSVCYLYRYSGHGNGPIYQGSGGYQTQGPGPQNPASAASSGAMPMHSVYGSGYGSGTSGGGFMSGARTGGSRSWDGSQPKKASYQLQPHHV